MVFRRLSMAYGVSSKSDARSLTPLGLRQDQGISGGWPAFRQSSVENQRKAKRVESCLVRCLDGGSSPPSSTRKGMTERHPFSCGAKPDGGHQAGFSNPRPLRGHPLSGGRRFHFVPAGAARLHFLRKSRTLWRDADASSLRSKSFLLIIESFVILLPGCFYKTGLMDI